MGCHVMMHMHASCNMHVTHMCNIVRTGWWHHFRVKEQHMNSESRLEGHNWERYASISDTTNHATLCCTCALKNTPSIRYGSTRTKQEHKGTQGTQLETHRFLPHQPSLWVPNRSVGSVLSWGRVTLHMASWPLAMAEIVICDYPHLSKRSRELNRSQKAASENGAYHIVSPEWSISWELWLQL